MRKTEKPIGKTLIIMNDVIVGTLDSEIMKHAPTEGKGLGKSAKGHAEKLKLIQRRCKRFYTVRLKQVIGIVEIESGKFVKGYVVDRLGIGGARYHVHPVSKVPERGTEVFDIDALTSAGRVPPIGQETYPERIAIAVPAP